LWLLVCAGCGRSGPADRFVPRAKGTLTFNKDIAPVVFQHCATCHRPGQAAPFHLLTYDDVKKHAKDVVRVTASRYMPPWLLEPGHGEFIGERRLTADQIGLIRQWVEEGASEGAASDLPPAPQWAEGWLLGQPDLVLTMPQPYTLPAEGRDVYRNFVLPIPVDGRKYVRAVEFRPGNRKIVHHAFMYIDRTPQSRRLDEQDAEPGFGGMHTPSSAQAPDGHFLSWQPGKVPVPARPGLSWNLEKGSDLLLQVHMQPSGKPELLEASIGFYFTATPPTNTLFKIGLRSYAIDIPAGQTDYVLEDAYTLPVDAHVMAVLPHAHYLARQMRGFATLPDGTQRSLFLIKDWDFNWQGDYHYVKPVFLAKGTTLSMRFTYDNSTNNTRNPHHPPQRVKYGLQTTDEMGELWLQILPRNKADLALLSKDYQARAFRDALAYNEYALSLNPNDARAHTELGKVKFFQGKPAEAIPHLRAAMQIQPDYDEPHYFLGLLYRMQKQPAEAKAEFTVAVRLNPDNFKTHGNLGALAMEEGNMSEAAGHFQNALRLNPEDPLALDSLGVIQFNLGQIDQAEQLFLAALRANPDEPDARQHLEAVRKAKAERNVTPQK
jgi:tetratricopeptide (TPR) repeat protein